MTAAAMRWVGLYLVLLLALSFLGVTSQRYHDIHVATSNEKEALLLERTERRIQEAQLNNPERVRQWALLNRMVPAASPEGAFLVAATPAPSLLELPSERFEVRTLWR